MAVESGVAFVNDDVSTLVETKVPGGPGEPAGARFRSQLRADVAETGLAGDGDIDPNNPDGE